MGLTKGHRGRKRVREVGGRTEGWRRQLMFCHAANDKYTFHHCPPGLLLMGYQIKGIFLSLLFEKFNNYNNNDNLPLYCVSYSLTYLWYLQFWCTKCFNVGYLFEPHHEPEEIRVIWEMKGADYLNTKKRTLPSNSLWGWEFWWLSVHNKLPPNSAA